MTQLPEAPRAMYELTGVSRSYHRGASLVKALVDVDVSIADREFVTVQGPTGSGKTTLLLLLGALDRPTAGTLVLDGRDTGKLGEGALTGLRARTLGFIFQNYNLLPTLSAAENVQAALVPLGVRGNRARQRALQALEDVGLADRARHLPTQLSGGEQQKVAIARALVKEPRVILADEPTGNMDEGTTSEIMSLLEGIHASREVTLVMATHDNRLGRRAPRTLMVSKGQVSIRKNGISPGLASAAPGTD